MKYFAHVRQPTEGKEKWEEHYLEDHLRAVASRAAQFAMAFGSGDWAELAGLWHDLGKYRQGFQKHIRTASGYEAEAHIETAPGRIDHSTAGAIHACQRFGLKGRILAYLIAGHHTGLLDWQSDTAGQKTLIQRLEKQQLLDATLTQTPPVQILQAAPPTSQPKKCTDPALWIRMLFSCLVDADFLDTEAFMDPGKAAERAGYPPLTELSRHFNSHMEKLKAEADDTRVNRVVNQFMWVFVN